MKRAFSGPLSLFGAGLCLAIAFAVLNSARTQGLPIEPLLLAYLGVAVAPVLVSERRATVPWVLFAAVTGTTVFAWGLSEVGRTNLGQLPGLAPLLVVSLGCASSLVVGRPPLPALTVGALIGLTMAVAYFSGGKGGASPFFQWLLDQGLDARSADAIVFVSRKSVHVAFYGCLALAIRSTIRTIAGDAKAQRWPAATLVWVAGYAMFDEARQSVSAGRGSHVLDVALDLVAAAVFILAAERRPRRPRPD